MENHDNRNNDDDDEELLNIRTAGPNISVMDSQVFDPTPLNYISAEFESLDYDTCVNTLSLDEQRKRGFQYFMRQDVYRWIIVFFVGVVTAIVACGIDISIEKLSALKYSFLKTNMDRCVFEDCLFVPFIWWVTINLGAVVIAAVLGSYIEPVAAGSGIPQVKCYLNGIKIPRVVRIKTLLAKGIGVTFSVLGGLAVGKEGPMIHSGAVIAAGLSQGKTTSFNLDFNILHYFREDHEKRDFVSAGAAAGVAAAFGAPVGGVLFSLEEGASFWNQSLTWRVLFGAMTSCFVLNFVLSIYNNHIGNLNYPGLLNFGKFDDLSYRMQEFIPFILMGAMGGLFGALFNYINYKLTVFRMRFLREAWKKIFEACLVSFLTATIGFIMIYSINECRDSDTESGGYPIQMFCEEGKVSTPAEIWFKTPEATVRSFFHDPKGSYEWKTIGIFGVAYFFLACITYGLGVPSGLFIPTLLTGAAWGRMCGMVLGLLFPQQTWVDEGKYALVGAAAMLGGVVRMTLSLTVILMECVGNITFGLPLMIVLMIAKWVGDYFNEGLYHIHIQLSGAPLMEWDPPPISNIFASEAMAKPVVTVNCVEKVSRIVQMLKSNTHNGFPVVDEPTDEVDSRLYFRKFGTLRGFILRSQLVVLLQHRVFNENDPIWMENEVNMRIFRKSYPRYPSIDSVELSAADLNCTIDLRPFMNTSPYTMNFTSTLPRMFRLFRALGLRHLTILDDSNQVVGIVTRKDLVKYRASHHPGTHNVHELTIYNRV